MYGVYFCAECEDIMFENENSICHECIYRNNKESPENSNDDTLLVGSPEFLRES